MTTQTIDARAIARSVARSLTGELESGGRLHSRVADQVADRLQDRFGDQLAEIANYRRHVRESTRHRADAPGAVFEHGLITALNPALPNPNAIGAPLNRSFGSFGEFLCAVAIAGKGGPRDGRLRVVNEDGTIRADLSGNQLSTGGAIVPDEFRSTILVMGLQATSIRPRTFQLPMATNRLGIPKLRDTSHASTVFGGVRAYWTKAGTAITESQPTLDRVWLEANGLKLLTDIENDLLLDSLPTAETILVRLWVEAVGWYEEQAFLGGSGVGEPLGVRESAAFLTVSRATSNQVKVADIAEMEARLLPGSQSRAVWMASPAVMGQLVTLNNGAVQVWHPDLTGRIPGFLNGRPLIVTEHLPTLGQTGDLMLVDWGYYLLGDRQSLSIAASPHAKFENDVTTFRGVERLDGAPWIDSAITPANGGPTLSPFVGLAA